MLLSLGCGFPGGHRRARERRAADRTTRSSSSSEHGEDPPFRGDRRAAQTARSRGVRSIGSADAQAVRGGDGRRSADPDADRLSDRLPVHASSPDCWSDRRALRATLEPDRSMHPGRSTVREAWTHRPLPGAAGSLDEKAMRSGSRGRCRVACLGLPSSAGSKAQSTQHFALGHDRGERWRAGSGHAPASLFLAAWVPGLAGRRLSVGCRWPAPDHRRGLELRAPCPVQAAQSPCRRTPLGRPPQEPQGCRR